MSDNDDNNLGSAVVSFFLGSMAIIAGVIIGARMGAMIDGSNINLQFSAPLIIIGIITIIMGLICLFSPPDKKERSVEEIKRENRISCRLSTFVITEMVFFLISLPVWFISFILSSPDGFPSFESGLFSLQIWFGFMAIGTVISIIITLSGSPNENYPTPVGSCYEEDLSYQ